MRILRVLLFICIMMVTVAAHAATPLMPVEELREGMTGYAKTVIEGDTIETFPVTVLGVSGSETTGYQILIRAGGDVMDRSGGIAQGMSGSPVYFDGRLAGAVAFGKAYTDPHFCFLTPIHDMLELLDRPTAHYEGLLPKGTRLAAGGFTAPALEYLNARLAPMGLSAEDTGTAGISREIRDLEPGSSVAVSVMDGDMKLGAIGTVTWMDEAGHVLAFGHPFMQRGAANFFLNKAWIFGSLPNYESAYKVGAVGPAVGRVSQDRSTGVAGELGQMPQTIPFLVTVADATRSLSRSARVRLVYDELLAPALAGSVTVNMAGKVLDFAGGGTARVAFDVQAKNEKDEPLRVQRDNMVFAREKLGEAIPDELVESLKVLLQNKLEKVQVRQVNVQVEMDEEPRLATLEGVKVAEQRVAPGDTLHITARLRPYRAKVMTKELQYKLPLDAEPGELKLAVRGGAVRNWIQALQRAQQAEQAEQGEAPQKQEPPSVKAYVDKLNKADRNNEIIVDQAPPEEGQKGAASREGTSDVAEMERAAKRFSARAEGTRLKQHFPMDFIVEGEAMVTVQVERDS